jgi:hypothetical protein
MTGRTLAYSLAIVGLAAVLIALFVGSAAIVNGNFGTKHAVLLIVGIVLLVGGLVGGARAGAVGPGRGR